MVALKAGTIALIVIGGIVLLIGVSTTAFAFLPSTQAETFTIPSGAQWYYTYSLSIIGGGRVSGSFQELAGGTVDVFVFTDAQYQQYTSSGSASSLFTTNGSSGQWDVALPGSGTYHLVFQHGTGYDNTAQDVKVNFTLAGIGPPSYLAGGIIALAIGTALVAFGVRRRKRQERAARAVVPPPASNVVFYQPPGAPPYQPPSPPQQPPQEPGSGGQPPQGP